MIMRERTLGASQRKEEGGKASDAFPPCALLSCPSQVLGIFPPGVLACQENSRQEGVQLDTTYAISAS